MVTGLEVVGGTRGPFPCKVSQYKDTGSVNQQGTSTPNDGEQVKAIQVEPELSSLPGKRLSTKLIPRSTIVDVVGGREESEPAQDRSHAAEVD